MFNIRMSAAVENKTWDMPLDSRQIPGSDNVRLPSRKEKNDKKKRFSSFKQLFSKSQKHGDICQEGPHTTQENNKHGRTKKVTDILGYCADRDRAVRFFQKTLGYDVEYEGPDYVNCNKDRLMRSLWKIQQTIIERATHNGGSYYDRFVFIILTHGDKGGLLTCADRNGVKFETKYERHVQEWILTRIEDIEDCFKPDNVPQLKDKPKLFLVQACRGPGIVKTAGGDQIDSVLPQYDLSILSLRPEVPIDADILIYYATTPDNKCWVGRKGSWFIQKTLDVFERHYKQRHVEEMLTLINLIISQERDVIQGQAETAVQMPCKLSTLRMNFYL